VRKGHHVALLRIVKGKTRKLGEIRNRGGLVISVSSCEATDQGSFLCVAIFPVGSGVADSKRSENCGDYKSAIEMLAVKSS